MVKRTDNQQEVGFSPHHIGNPFITANREEILYFWSASQLVLPMNIMIEIINICIYIHIYI